jgi:hypothetical protein
METKTKEPAASTVKAVEQRLGPWKLSCHKCGKDLTSRTLVMTDINGALVKGGPGGSPLFLSPARCPSCGTYFIEVPERDPDPAVEAVRQAATEARAKLWTPGGEG